MRLISTILAGYLLFGGVSYANETINSSSEEIEDGISIDFSDLEIDDFIKSVAKITNKNILVSTPIKGKVDFVSHEPIPKDKIYDLLLTILSNKGYTIVDTGSGFLNVVKLSTAVKNNLTVMKNTQLPQMLTKIIKVKNENVDIIASKIRHLLSKSGKLITAKESNNLIISDFPSNIDTIQDVVDFLERSMVKVTEFVQIENTKVSLLYNEIVKISKSIFNQKIEDDKVDVLKNDITNTIILIGKDKNIETLKSYIEKLDIKDEVTKQIIEVYPLVNSDSNEVAKILTTILTKKAVQDKDNKAPKPMITSNDSLNSLIIVATNEELEEIKQVAKLLDIEKQQVYIRAKIVEVSRQKAKKVGIELLDDSLTFIASKNSFDLLSSKILSLAQSLPQEKKNRFYNEETEQYEYETTQQGININDYTSGLVIGANISFLKRNGVANTLSEPTLLCLDNKESSIKVGEVRSILISQKGATANSDGESKYSRENIGLDLKIKPRISNDEKVTLDINIKLEEAQTSIYDNGRPTTTNREVKTTTIVRNGESIIIGGLTKSTSSLSKNKIPLLGDIPVAGELFTSEFNNKDQINLVIVLTPYIVGKESNISELKRNLESLDQLQREITQLYMDEFDGYLKPLKDGDDSSEDEDSSNSDTQEISQDSKKENSETESNGTPIDDSHFDILINNSEDF
jgi:general secretion pathway protein D